MRVISGTARGRRLHEPPGVDTRPTTDRVKETLFNIIQFDIEGRRVLDLFAGSGQLGIEALSRGAAHCVFVEQSEKIARLIRENLALTGFADRATVARQDASAYLTACHETFDLIFLDPPYHTVLRDRALQTIAAIDNLSVNGIIICESAADEDLPDLPLPYEKGRTYRCGTMKLTLYRRRALDEVCDLPGQL